MWQPFPSSWVGRALWLFLLCTLPLPAATLSLPHDSALQGSDLSVDQSPTLQARDNDRFLLKIMPLGASITWGYLSTDGNGYRNWIRQQLRNQSWEVEMVGSKRHGDMLDNRNEGYFGYRVDQLPAKVTNSINENPNLILINAGTDDALENHQLGSIGERMDYLLTLLYDSVPNTTIVLSTLLPNKAQEARVGRVSRQYRELVARRRAQQDRIVLAEMSFLDENDLNDSTHPTDYGYKKMASVWWSAIQDAQNENMIQKFNYSISEKAEANLDNSTDDPHLPVYNSPAQPTGEAYQFTAQLLWIVGFSLIFFTLA